MQLELQSKGKWRTYLCRRRSRRRWRRCAELPKLPSLLLCFYSSCASPLVLLFFALIASLILPVSPPVFVCSQFACVFFFYLFLVMVFSWVFFFFLCRLGFLSNHPPPFLPPEICIYSARVPSLVKNQVSIKLILFFEVWILLRIKFESG
jgi:lipopolysaccharide export LptBFGC system permease protein LptF